MDTKIKTTVYAKLWDEIAEGAGISATGNDAYTATSWSEWPQG